MTDNQKKNLQTVANVVAMGREQVSESFIVGQVMLVTGRTYAQAIQGVKLMQSEKVFPEKLIKPETVGVLERMTQNNPAIKKFFERFDVVPGKTELIEFQGFVKPLPIGKALLFERFKLPRF